MRKLLIYLAFVPFPSMAYAQFGIKAQIETGEGTEFHALKEFAVGMEPRSIDWKQSARHGKLVAKENRTERNHQIILALDSGRLMSSPLAGIPRIDSNFASSARGPITPCSCTTC